MDAKTALRGTAWAAGGIALLLAPGVVRTMGEGGHLPLGYYLWTSAIPLAFVAAALAWALRDRLGRWRRALGAAALAALLAYLAVLCASCLGTMRLGAALRWPEWALRYAAWALWGVALAVWVPPADDAGSPSPLGCRPGAETLTEREREVVEALVTGSTQAQVAEALAISPSTVATYRARACEKLGVASLDEIAPREVGAAVVPPAMGVTSSGALPLMAMALCAGLTLRLLTRVVVSSEQALSQALGILAVLAALVVPWLVLLGYARLRDMRVRPRRLTAGLSVVLLALAAAGMLVGGGWYGLEVRLGSETLSVNAFAPVAHAVALALLAPHLLWPKTREALRLDEERCVLYLRGRGAGELQAHVLLKIALGLSTPEVCEALHVAAGTVNAYRAQGYELLGIHSSRQLADLLARDVGFVPSAGKNGPPADDSDTSV
ncbi:MAG TPA: LuxR C-terminal-related transcriptional regulator [Candidatus Olsenella stercoravium]|uniref:LuxR C-terminal-related transcriptional regulator n=1 Tax=Candidatus Olsenella stercoravium TaxID=2838713 RepID=A0A9D2DL05_9ACTN|nr:LuxR C-terminal-related transcriptional regulator [Candidatus Olsenella stercoravium]